MSEFVEVKISELSGIVLDWAVQYCREHPLDREYLINVPVLGTNRKYSTVANDAYELILQYGISVLHVDDEFQGMEPYAATMRKSCAYFDNSISSHDNNMYFSVWCEYCIYGSTPLEAICRCFVKSVHDLDTFYVPSELLNDDSE